VRVVLSQPARYLKDDCVVPEIAPSDTRRAHGEHAEGRRRSVGTMPSPLYTVAGAGVIRAVTHTGG
jgi:hypothetical protein